MALKRPFRLIVFLFVVLVALLPGYAQEAPPSGFFVQFEMAEGKVKSLDSDPGLWAEHDSIAEAGLAVSDLSPFGMSHSSDTTELRRTRRL